MLNKDDLMAYRPFSVCMKNTSWFTAKINHVYQDFNSDHMIIHARTLSNSSQCGSMESITSTLHSTQYERNARGNIENQSAWHKIWRARYHSRFGLGPGRNFTGLVYISLAFSCYGQGRRLTSLNEQEGREFKWWNTITLTNASIILGLVKCNQYLIDVEHCRYIIMKKYYKSLEKNA